MPRTAYIDPLAEQANYIALLERRIAAMERRAMPGVITNFPELATEPVAISSTAVPITGELDFTFAPGRRYRIGMVARAIEPLSTTNQGSLHLWDGSTNLIPTFGGAWHWIIPGTTLGGYQQASALAWVAGPTSGTGTRFQHLHWRASCATPTNLFARALGTSWSSWIEDVGQA